MSQPASLLDEALTAWRYTREGVIAEAANIPADRYGFRPADESRTVAELIVHIIEAGWLMGGELPNPEGDFTRQSYPDHLREHAGDIDADQPRDALLTLLRTSGEEGRARIREAGEIAMLQQIRQFDGSPATRLSWFNHGIDHESYHRGQLALYARIMGLTPALTQQIQGGG